MRKTLSVTIQIPSWYMTKLQLNGLLNLNIITNQPVNTFDIYVFYWSYRANILWPIIYLLFICLSSSLLIWQIYVFLMYMVFKVVLFNVICLKVMYNLDNLKSWAHRTSLANLLYHKLSFLNIHKDIQLNVSLNTHLAVVTSEVSCVSLSI